jgi:hypothetical protein
VPRIQEQRRKARRKSDSLRVVANPRSFIVSRISHKDSTRALVRSPGCHSFASPSLDFASQGELRQYGCMVVKHAAGKARHRMVVERRAVRFFGLMQKEEEFAE